MNQSNVFLYLLGSSKEICTTFPTWNIHVTRRYWRLLGNWEVTMDYVSIIKKESARNERSGPMDSFVLCSEWMLLRSKTFVSAVVALVTLSHLIVAAFRWSEHGKMFLLGCFTLSCHIETVRFLLGQVFSMHTCDKSNEWISNFSAEALSTTGLEINNIDTCIVLIATSRPRKTCPNKTCAISICQQRV